MLLLAQAVQNLFWCTLLLVTAVQTPFWRTLLLAKAVQEYLSVHAFACKSSVTNLSMRALAI